MFACQRGNIGISQGICVTYECEPQNTKNMWFGGIDIADFLQNVNVSILILSCNLLYWIPQVRKYRYRN